MAITKMKVVTLSTDAQGLDRMLYLLSSCDNFHVEEARKVLDASKNGQVYEQNTQYMEYLGRMESVMRSLHIELPEAVDYTEEVALSEIEAKLTMVEENFEKVNNQLMSMSHLKKEDVEAITALREYDFEELHKSMYISVNFGRLPIQGVEKLVRKDDKRILYTILHKNKQYYWILYECLWEHQLEIEAYLKSLYFEPIAIPNIDDQKITLKCKDVIDSVYGYLKFRGSIQKMNKYVAVYGNRYVIKGFVPVDSCDELKAKFSEVISLEMSFEEPRIEDSIHPPIKLKNNALTRPFTMLIEMYGLPDYFDFDPTALMTITYSLLFGCMFGDLGQGIVLLVVSTILWKWKKMKLAAVGIRLGICSMIFGLIFGSFFGDEEIIGELFHQWGLPLSPFHVMDSKNTMVLLMMAVGMGCVLILFSILVNIINKIHKGKIGEAVFHQNGIAGFVFYGSIMLGATLQIGMGINVMTPVLMIPFLGIPVIMILFQHPFQNLVCGKGFHIEEGWGGYIMTSFFEAFEVLLSFVSNTMSFMRVGGFVLSHAGMMLVVVSLQQMSGPFGSIPVFILGNLLVMVLEGLVVGIQTLRLEYYEMFSRYFDATGHKFVPVGYKIN